MAESHGKSFSLQQCKFRGIVKPGDGQMVFRRLEILADGNDVAMDCSKIAHDLPRFVECLPIPTIKPDFVFIPSCFARASRSIDR